MIRFVYNGNMFYTDNLPKKLKRLKITENDITDVHEFEEKKKSTDTEDINYTYIYFFDPETKHTHIFAQKTAEKPTDKNIFFKDLLKNNGDGTGYYTAEIVDRVVLLNGIPKYPINIKSDGTVELETIYNW